MSKKVRFRRWQSEFNPPDVTLVGMVRFKAGLITNSPRLVVINK